MLAAALGALPAVANAEPDPTGAGKLLLVLDSSGSMKETDASGTTKIAAAKDALSGVVDNLPQDAAVGLRVYGATVFERSDPGACTDSQLVVPIGPADKPALKQAIQSYKPYGETPIAYSLKQAAKDVGAEGQRTILLLSDGEETCDPDPCAVARAIGGSGIDLKIDVVGLDVGAKARSQLTCIANAGHGTYHDARDAGDLAATLGKTALRALRPFSTSGTPIEGAAAASAAPAMPAGQYTDTLGGTAEKTGLKYYKMPVTAGSTLRVAVIARPPKPLGSRPDDVQKDAFGIDLTTPAGDSCAWFNATRIDLHDANSVVAGAVIMDPVAAGEPCAKASHLVLKLRRGLDTPGFAPQTGDMPVEISVMEEPAVTNLDKLPTTVSDNPVTQEGVAAQASSGQVKAGGTFTDAAELSPGTVRDTLRAGEVLFYKVHVDWGQAPAVTFRLQSDSRMASLLDPPGRAVSIVFYAPDRGEISPAGQKGYSSMDYYTGKETLTLGANLPPVHYRNRESTSSFVKPASIAGDYYASIQLASDSGGTAVQVPVEVSVDVTGSPSGQPEYEKLPGAAAANPGPNDDPGPGDGADSGADNGTSASASGQSVHTVTVPILPVAAGVVVLGLIVFALIARRRRRRRGRPAGGMMPQSWSVAPHGQPQYQNHQQNHPQNHQQSGYQPWAQAPQHPQGAGPQYPQGPRYPQSPPPSAPGQPGPSGPPRGPA